ncbi:MGMT family protein [Marinobacterium arenosum]|uniref:MGMT family protein n=1 Tax=Marinobacterium arenosum TaxID=2862496 RepID=UPI001C986888|nr:MGMT family protein [Marinobacterium arenosum]MBY4678213.1 MGMT family protein [Marinobacterium arenosum]
MDELMCQKVWQVVAAIPPGKVASYGQVAELAGLPRMARMVGRILSQLPKDSQLPWFRVINAQGRISFPLDSDAYRCQRERLEADGVEFNGERINLRVYRWSGEAD